MREIRERQAAGWHVAAMNGSYKFLLERGITPQLFFMCDARPQVNLPFLDDPHTRTVHVIASQCDPEIFERLHSYQVRIWPLFHDQEGYDAIGETRAAKYGDDQPQQPAARFAGRLNVGQSCLAPIWAMGYRTWALFGYDGSAEVTEITAQSDEHGDQVVAINRATHAFIQPQNAGEPIAEFYWPLRDGERVEGVTKCYACTPTMASAAQAFPELVQSYRAQGVQIEMRCEGLIPDMVASLAPIEQPRQVGTLEGQQLVSSSAPIAAKPRRPGRKTHGLPIVTFKWDGHIAYMVDDVRKWASQVCRFMHGACELVCITDRPEDLQGVGVRAVPMWRDQFEHGRDWHRLKLFAEEMADVIGPRFAVMDLDTVICGDLDPLFDTDAPYKAWHDPYKDQYCTALQLMDAGAFPHVWEQFDKRLALFLRQSGRYNGYDQAWISHALPGMPRWTAADGVLSFRKDLLGGRPIEHFTGLAVTNSYRDAPPPGARVINFHGKHNPRDEDVQAAFPWIGEFYR